MDKDQLLEIVYNGYIITIKLNISKLLTYNEQELHNIATHEAAHLYYNIERIVNEARKNKSETTDKST